MSGVPPLRIAAIVQARMSSTRLPGKVLAPLAGKPLLQYLIERLLKCRELNGVIVATSREWSDAPVARVCKALGMPCFRGSLEDVASRFAAAAREHALDAFVRVCGDSPLLDGRLVDQLVQRYRDWHAAVDVVTNVLPRTYPAGQSVEVVRTGALLEAMPLMNDPADREHVTRLLYANADRFRITNVRAERDMRDVRLVVDTPEDLEEMSRIIAAMDRPQWLYTLEDILWLQARARLAPRRIAPAA